MTIRELESEFILGQKYAIEAHFEDYDDEGNLYSQSSVSHHVCGDGCRIPYLDNNISYLRTFSDEIYIVLRNLEVSCV